MATANGVLANDSDPENSTLTAELWSAPEVGTLTLATDGSFVYNFAPRVSFSGPVTFTYKPVDNAGSGDPVTVTLSIINAVPVASNDAATTNEDSPLTVSVLSNDSDLDSDSLMVARFTHGAHGAVEFDNASLKYTPDPNWFGTDTFTYTVDDGFGGTATATVTVTVDSVNDAPDAANDGPYGTLQNQYIFIPVLVNDSDVDGDTLTVTAATQGAHGTVSFTSTGVTYTPATGYTGTDSFTYTISDGHGGTSTATVNVVVVAPSGASGQLWMDFDHDGIQDAGEPLYFGSVMIYLWDSNNNLVAVTNSSGGSYSFTNLAAGSYRVQVSIPPGFTVSPQDVGGNNAIDNDFNLSGYSAVFTLTAGGTLDLDIGWY